MKKNLENKIWVFIQNRRLQKFLSNTNISLNFLESFKSNGLSLTKYKSLKYFTKRKKQNKEKYTFNTTKDSLNNILLNTYKDVFVLSKLTNINFFNQDQLIEYLYLLNNKINQIETNINEHILSIIDSYQNNKIVNMDFIDYFKEQNNLDSYSNEYNKALIRLKLFFKYFSKYCKTNDLNKYKEKLNLRSFNDLKYKVYENIQLKSNDFKINSNKIDLTNTLEQNNKILKSNNENKTNYYKNDDYSNNNNSSNDMLTICTIFAAV